MEKSFVFTENMKKVVNKVPKEQRLQFYEGIVYYGLYGEMPENVDPWVECVLIALGDQFR